jgi:3-hydroxyisobutyrate dehydrogenase
MPLKIGFIGTGIMGRPMAENLARAGVQITVYNRTGDKAAALAEAGAKVAGTPKAAAKGADALVFMVTGPDAAELFADRGDLPRGGGPAS